MRISVLKLMIISLVILTSCVCVYASEYNRGPDPTDYALEADLGPFSYRSANVSSWSASGFGGGIIFYPTNTSEGPFAGIAICPGYYESASQVDWWGPRLASNGFVVIVINPNNTYIDQPPSRANQLLSALTYIKNRSSTYNLDVNRLGLMGHSMGGGGTLIAAQNSANDPAIKAAIPLAPWSSSPTNFSGIKAATLVVACQSDTIAPVAQHASPFYNSLSSSIKKMFIEFAGDDHFCVIDGNSHYALLGKLGVAWMKYFLDEDERYSPFICGINYGSEWEVSTFKSNCPFDSYIPPDDDDDDDDDNAIINGTYSLINVNSGKAMDTWGWGTTDGTNIAQYNYWGGDAQKFNIASVDGIWHRISPAIASDQAVDVSGCVTDPGANIQTWSYWGGACQQFRFENAGNGQYNVIARNSGLCLDVLDWSQDDGANIIQWNCYSGAANQLFELIQH